MPELLRFFAALLFSCALIVSDLHFGAFAGARAQMSTLVAPFRLAAELPVRIADGARDYLAQRETLVRERDELRLLLAQEKVRLRSLDFFTAQNDELRARLNLAGRGGEWLAADVARSIAHPHSGRIRLNKGLDDGISAGMAVVDNDGVIGQVVRVDSSASVVRLLSDANQGVAARVRRNRLLVVLRGAGDGSGELIAEYIARTADLRAGDELVADGGLFPPGHPVGTVIERERGVPYDRARVEPSAAFSSSRVVLIYAAEGAAQTPRAAEAAAQ